MRVLPIPCLEDNYAYLLVSEERRAAAVVDPSEAAPVEEALAREGLDLEMIVLTHHHWDHVGGIVELLAKRPRLDVVGSAYDRTHQRIPHQTRGVEDGERFDCLGIEVEVLAVPGHTLGAVAYRMGEHLFTGDTLFLGGCGRVFEGTMETMCRSMDRFRRLDPALAICCGHEYTVRNLEFANSVEPENEAVRAALLEARERRQSGLPTVPGRLERELETNPFLRFDIPSLAKGRDPLAAFTALREAKNRF